MKQDDKCNVCLKIEETMKKTKRRRRGRGRWEERESESARVCETGGVCVCV